MKFKYRKLNFSAPFARKKILRPIIPFSIHINKTNRKARYEALIDSGADFNILPLGLTEVLNINPKGLKEIYFAGIDGEMLQGLIANIKMSLGDFEFSARVVFAEISGAVGILGQYGFFNKFTVKFDLQKEDIEIKERN